MHRKHLIKALGLSVLVIVGVMAVSASAAQAGYLLLLNGNHVSSLTLELEGLGGYLEAENGLAIECGSGSGTATVENGESKLTGSASGTFEECVWVGAEGICSINDEGEGLIHASGTGEAFTETEESTDLIVTAESENFATIHTEGIFCPLEGEEVISGKVHVKILNAFSNSTVKLGHLMVLDVKLGESRITALEGDVHLRDANNLSATIGVDLT